MADKSDLLKVGISAALGWSLGRCVKKLGKATAIIAATNLVALQRMLSSPYVGVKWSKISHDFGPNGKGFWRWLHLLWSIALFNFPFLATFIVGFYVGYQVTDL